MVELSNVFCRTSASKNDAFWRFDVVKSSSGHWGAFNAVFNVLEFARFKELQSKIDSALQEYEQRGQVVMVGFSERWMPAIRLANVFTEKDPQVETGQEILKIFLDTLVEAGVLDIQAQRKDIVDAFGVDGEAYFAPSKAVENTEEYSI